LLSQLHRSELVKKILFNKSDQAEGAQEPSSCRDHLDAATVSRLDDQIEQMKILCPELGQWW